MTAPSPRPAGRLTFDPQRLPSRSYWVGSFYAHWQTEQGGVLAVRHAARPDRALWASPPGESFVAAAHVSSANRAGWRYIDQHIEQITAADGVLVVSGVLLASDGSAPVAYSLRLSAATAKDLTFSLSVAAPCNRVMLVCASDAAEQLWGFGDTSARRNRKGRRVVVTAAAQAAGRAEPHYVTSRLRSFYLEGAAHAVFDLRRPEHIQVSVRAAQMSGHILYGVSYDDLLATYAASRCL